MKRKHKSLIVVALCAVGFAAFAEDADTVGTRGPIGGETDPWLLGPATNKTETVAWTNGTTLVVVAGSGAVTNGYALSEGKYIVTQKSELQRPDGRNWNGRVEVTCLVFDPAAGALQFGSNIKLGLEDSARAKRLHRIVNGVLEYDDLMLNLTGAPQFVTLIWDAALDGVEEGHVGTVTAATSGPMGNPNCPVTVQNGTFVGVLDGETKVRSWKGIPYAVQPTGVNRWKAMGDPVPSGETFAAKQFGHAAIQRCDPTETGGYVEQGDDCLVLNVWSADEKETVGCDYGKRPVMVYIHGGAFVLGGSADIHYDGRNIVERNKDVVVVTINYRVGLLGFVDFKDVPGGEKFPDAQKLGILDQRQALKWVQKNIGQFGGDPGNVTIFGESAGGGSVAIHLTSSESAPYFRRAIQMSGGLDLDQTEKAVDGRRLVPELVAAVAKLRFGDVSKTNCVDMTVLQSLTPDEIRNLMETPADNQKTEKDGLSWPAWDIPSDDISGGGGTIAFSLNFPICDDERGCVPTDPFRAFMTNGVANGKDYMVGTVRNEMRYFTGYEGPDDPLRWYYTGFIADRMRMNKVWLGKHAGLVDGFIAAYEDDGVRDEMDTRYPGIWKMTALEDQLYMRLSAIKMADIHAKLPADPKSGYKGKTYMYRFDKCRELTKEPWSKAGHACENDYVFHNTSCVDYGRIDEDLADKVNAAFVNFARTGDPNGGAKVGEAKWEQYEVTDRKTMLFRNDCTTSLASDPDKGARMMLLESGAYDTYHEARAKTANRTTINVPFVRDTSTIPTGTADKPWQVGRTADDDVIASTNATGKLVVKGAGDIRDFYAVGGGLWFGPTATEAEFAAGVKGIGSNMLSTCSGLRRIVVNSVTPPTLGENALPPVARLEAIHVPAASVGAYKAAWTEYASIITGI